MQCLKGFLYGFVIKATDGFTDSLVIQNYQGVGGSTLATFLYLLFPIYLLLNQYRGGLSSKRRGWTERISAFLAWFYMGVGFVAGNDSCQSNLMFNFFYRANLFWKFQFKYRKIQ